MNSLREDAFKIFKESMESVLPEPSVERALEGADLSGKLLLVSVGKAAWRMANGAKKYLGPRLREGIVVTKYGHSLGEIEGVEIFEAGHPIPDENSLRATKRVVELVSNLGSDYTVLFLVSGGGSALFEEPADGISLDDIGRMNDLLIRSGADISEINTVRKHLSKVKGGRFGKLAEPAKIFSLVLSDVIGDRLDTIASGPAYPDSSTSEDALRILGKYGIDLTENILKALKEETPKELSNVESRIVGSVSVLCERAKETSERLGYSSTIFTTSVDCEAREAGRMLSSVAREETVFGRPLKRPCALIFGGETVVKVTGGGLGGRNQELALSAAIGIKGMEDAVIASIGTDGTDGPTDAAGGIVDGKTVERIEEMGLDPHEMLRNNDSYHALYASGDLVVTGPTGTNVNDLILVLCR